MNNVIRNSSSTNRMGCCHPMEQSKMKVKVKVEEVLDSLTLSELKLMGAAMVDRMEATKRYVTREIEGYDILDYLIIGDSDKAFEVDMDELMKVSSKPHAVALGAIAGGMCEMSEMITKIAKEVKARK